MKNILLIIFLIFISLTIYGQNTNKSRIDNDHLVPLRSPFGPERHYNMLIQNILFDGISDYHIIQFFFMRSGRESVLVIERDTKNKKKPKYTIVFHHCKASIRNSRDIMDPKKITVGKYRKPISKDDVLKIEGLYFAALSKVSAGLGIFMGGHSYQFATGMQAGRACLRGKLTGKNKIERLVMLSEKLVVLTKSKLRKCKLSDALVLEIEKLTNDFKGTKRQ